MLDFSVWFLFELGGIFNVLPQMFCMLMSAYFPSHKSPDNRNPSKLWEAAVGGGICLHSHKCFRIPPIALNRNSQTDVQIKTSK